MSKWPWPRRLKRIVRSSPPRRPAAPPRARAQLVRRASARDDLPLGAGEEHRRREDVVLQVGLRADEAVPHELGDERCDAVVAQPAGVDRGGHEVVPERVHRRQRRQLARVAEVVREDAARQGREHAAGSHASTSISFPAIFSRRNGKASPAKFEPPPTSRRPRRGTRPRAPSARAPPARSPSGGGERG